jgi:hypothetical protein
MRAVATLIHSRFDMHRMRGALGAEMADALCRHLVSRAFLLQAAEMRFLVSLVFRTSALHRCDFCALLTGPGLHVVLFALALCHACSLRSLHCIC